MNEYIDTSYYNGYDFLFAHLAKENEVKRMRFPLTRYKIMIPVLSEN